MRAADKIRLLVVDDNQELCDILQSYFEIVDEVELCGVAHNGEEALSFIAQQHPDVVLLDIIMPKLDGLSVLERIHEEPPVPMPRVIVASAIGQENVTRRALELGANYYLIKPYQLPDLLSRIMLVAREGKREAEQEQRGMFLPSDRIAEILMADGMPTNIVGYQYCVRAIEILLKEKRHCPLGKYVYSTIAEENDTTVSCVESAIRKAVGTISGKMVNQPSNGRFLTDMTERMRHRILRRSEEE